LELAKVNPASAGLRWICGLQSGLGVSDVLGFGCPSMKKGVTACDDGAIPSDVSLPILAANAIAASQRSRVEIGNPAKTATG
jgi:hypothetical protein